jgi:ACS family hexuronate transporter-like MFS transporter
MRAMFIFACFPLLGLLAQPLGAYSAWWPAILIGLLGAGHQAWSANLFSTIGDMFPKSTIGTIVGLGTMAGGIGSMSINFGSGKFFDWAAELSIEKVGVENAFTFFGFDGKPAAYMVVFCICAVAYLIGWFIMKALVPKYKPIEV